MKKLVLMSLVIMLAGCAGLDAKSRSGQWQGSGFLQGGQGEYHLFSDPSKIGIYPGYCTTLVARNRRASTTYSKYVSKVVKTRGSVIFWPGENVHSLAVGGNHVTNLCNSKIIIIISTLEIL